jgi:hypothetical protein
VKCAAVWLVGFAGFDVIVGGATVAVLTAATEIAAAANTATNAVRKAVECRLKRLPALCFNRLDRIVIIPADSFS